MQYCHGSCLHYTFMSVPREVKFQLQSIVLQELSKLPKKIYTGLSKQLIVGARARVCVCGYACVCLCVC